MVVRAMISKTMLVSPSRTVGERSLRKMILWWCMIVVSTPKFIERRVVTRVMMAMLPWKLLCYWYLQLTLAGVSLGLPPEWMCCNTSSLVVIWVGIFYWFSSTRRRISFYCCNILEMFNMSLFAHGNPIESCNCWKSCDGSGPEDWKGRGERMLEFRN